MMPIDLPNDAERAQDDLETEDVSDEYEPIAYSEGFELTEEERELADMEN